jgi:hypothetical protein
VVVGNKAVLESVEGLNNVEVDEEEEARTCCRCSCRSWGEPCWGEIAGCEDQ